jgi:hypothetical protein
MTEQQPAKPKRPRSSTTRSSTTRRGVGRRAAPAAILADERIRQERAYQLKLLGCMTFQEIADSEHPEDPERKLYADKSAARRGWLAAVERHAHTEDTVAARELWTLRNERVFRVILAKVGKTGPDQLWAIDRYTRLLEVHARMLGLFQDKLQITPGETDLEKALRELSAEVAAAAGGAPVPVEAPAPPE